MITKVETQMIKNIIFTLIFYSVAVTTIAQNCSCVSTAKDKKTGKETTTGIVNSSDFFIFFIQKETNTNDLDLEPKYLLLLNAASRIVLSDSLVNTKGVIELILKDNIKLILENATCFNNPMPFGFCIAFRASVTKEQLEIIANNPIVTFRAFDLLNTSFNERRQKEQQKIANCLLN
jgi:hypothetical protein